MRHSVFLGFRVFICEMGLVLSVACPRLQAVVRIQDIIMRKSNHHDYHLLQLPGHPFSLARSRTQPHPFRLSLG